MKVIKLGRQKPCENTIKMLQSALELAQAGQLRTAVILGLGADDFKHVNFTIYPLDSFELMGVMALAQHSLIESLSRGEDAGCHD